MTGIADAASLVVPLVALPALVGAIMRWCLQIRLRPQIEVGVAAGALQLILVLILGGLVCGRSLVGYEGRQEPEGLSSLFFFFGVLGIPIAVAIALRVRAVIARNAGKPAA